MTPLMTPAHGEFATVRRHADELRAWFARETGWALHIERDCARLYKRPADLSDASRGLPGYERRRYVLLTLLCLACAVLERRDPQITLRVLGERLLGLANRASAPRAPLRCRPSMNDASWWRCTARCSNWVLQRVAGDEEGFVRSGGEDDDLDALYDVHRRVLAGMLAAVRGPSTWAAEDAPATLDDRLAALITERISPTVTRAGERPAPPPGAPPARRPCRPRHTLDAELRAYFANQRGMLAARLCEAAERPPNNAPRAWLWSTTAPRSPMWRCRPKAPKRMSPCWSPNSWPATTVRRGDACTSVAAHEVIAFVAQARQRYGTYWRKSAREAGAENELALRRLERLSGCNWSPAAARRYCPGPR